MLLEDCLGEMIIPIYAMDTIVNTAENECSLGFEKEQRYKILSLMITMRFISRRLVKLHKKYNIKVNEAYADGTRFSE